MSTITQSMRCVALCSLICATQHLRSQVAIRIPDASLDVQAVSLAGGRVWLATTKGAYAINEYHADRVPNEGLVVNKVESLGNSIWIASSSGAYKIEGTEAKRVPDQILDVLTLNVVNGNDVWLATAKGAYTIRGDSIKTIGPSDVVVHQIVSDDETVWLATNRGAYRISNTGTSRRLPDIPTIVNNISVYHDVTWISTTEGAYRITRDGGITQYGAGLDVVKVCDVNGGFWLATDKGAYRVTGATQTREPDIEMAVEDVVAVGSTIWLASNRGAYRLGNGGDYQKFPPNNLAIKKVVELNGRIWLMSYRGAFLLTGDVLRRIPNLDINVQEISSEDGKIWIASTSGAYRVDDISINAQFVSADSWWKSILEKFAPWPVLVEGNASIKIQYIGLDGEPVTSDALTSPHFQIIVDSNTSALNRSIQDQKYSAAETFRMTLPSGRHTFYVSVRDKWGNTSETKVSEWILPGQATGAILAPACWLILLGTMIALAPSSEFVNDLLMNPWLRNISSFGLIPLMMTVMPGVRRHMLKRYLRNLVLDDAFGEWLKRYEVPATDFCPSSFGARLSTERVLQITGQSGIGKTSYLRFLVACYTRHLAIHDRTLRKRYGEPGDSAPIAPAQGVPVFIPLARYQGQGAPEMVAAQLASYGGLTDKQLVAWYIQQGGFIFLFDGLNEIDQTTRNNVNRFVDEGRHKNYFCISSQEAYPGFAWITR